MEVKIKKRITFIERQIKRLESRLDSLKNKKLSEIGHEHVGQLKGEIYGFNSEKDFLESLIKIKYWEE